MCLQDSILTNAEQKLCALSFSNLIFVYEEKFSRGMMKEWPFGDIVRREAPISGL